MKRILIVVAMIGVCMVDAAAVTFGSIPFEQDKLVDGQAATYSLGLINPMNETVTVDLETTGTGPLEVVSDQEIELQPSETSANPSGSGWMVYEEGYIKPTRTSISVRLPRSASEQEHTFSVTPTINGELPGGAGSAVAFATEHAFRFETTLPLSNDETEERGWPIIGNGDDGQDRTGEDSAGQETEDEPARRSGSRDQSPITGTTLILLASIIIVSTYIWRQIR